MVPASQLDWLKETLALLRGTHLASDTLWDNLQVRAHCPEWPLPSAQRLLSQSGRALSLQVAYCMASVLRKAGPALSGPLSDIRVQALATSKARLRRLPEGPCHRPAATCTAGPQPQWLASAHVLLFCPPPTAVLSGGWHRVHAQGPV